MALAKIHPPAGRDYTLLGGDSNSKACLTASLEVSQTSSVYEHPLHSSYPRHSYSKLYPCTAGQKRRRDEDEDEEEEEDEDDE